jgi:hypothetical protein
MGKQVSLHPVAVALSVLAGTLIAGILGAVISVPLVAVAWAVFARLRRLDPPTDFDELDRRRDGEDEADDTFTEPAEPVEPAGADEDEDVVSGNEDEANPRGTKVPVGRGRRPDTVGPS